MPTTAGTGTEVTFWSVITDTKRKFKMSVGSPLIAAKVALVDPLLTVTLPKDITAFTGIDALVHAIEGYTSMLAQPVSDVLALSAIELISENIRKAYANGNNVEARYNMMLGSMLAGISFGNSDVASVHCMGEAMGGLGRIHRMDFQWRYAFPIVLNTICISNPEKFADIACALGEDIEGLSTLEAARLCVVAIKSMFQDLNIPSARSIGLKKKDLNKLAGAAAVNVSVESNPEF